MSRLFKAPDNSVDYRDIQNWLGDAFQFDGEANVTNPPQSGQVLTALTFTVATTPIDLSTTPQYNLEQLQISYDGKQLTFSEICTPSVAYPSFALNAEVELKLDLGGGQVTYFKGRIKQRSHKGKNNNDSIEYTALGYQNLANEVVCRDENGVPLVYFPSEYITFIPSNHGTYTIFGIPIWLAINDLFTRCSTALAEIGIPATIGTPGSDSFTGVLPNDVSLQNCGFVEGLKQVCAYEPDKKPFFDDKTQTWIFPQVLEAPIVDLRINNVNMDELNYNLDLSNRYTRLQLVTAYESTQGMTKRGVALCEPAWDTSLQSTYSIQKGVGVNTPTDVGGADNWVYRRWTIPDITDKRHPTAPVRAYAIFDMFSSSPKWVPVTANVDFTNKTVTTAMPVMFGKRNPYHPGHAMVPDALVVAYYSMNAVPDNGWYIYNYPSDGSYTGTAYTEFGVEQTKIEIIDPTGFNTGNARAKLATLKDVIVSGTVNLEGDPIPELINLQKRVRVVHDSQLTGLENFPAVYQSYTYQFGRRGKSTINMSTDKSNFVRVI